jgi:hypothetical protein
MGNLAVKITEHDKAVLAVAADYRMAGFRKPFTQSDRFNHVFKAGANLSLCHGLAVARPDRLGPLDLAMVDCIACMDLFTEATRPLWVPGA